MARLKIDYGIDLGTTNSAICRLEKGEPVIIKSDTLKDTMPSCVSFNKKKSSKVGDGAYNDMKSDKRRATKSWKKSASNTYIEFKRTMGGDTKYNSSFMEKDFTSEELSAEVLKTLKSFVQDENVKSAVITVPAKFTINQKDATMRAAKMAGFEHCELLQEPIAASMAYGLSSDQKNGYWMVFDFGGGTFDAALLKVEDGIMQVFDTEGDNYLGGKNLDYAIVDQIIIPYLQDNFSIDEILEDEDKKTVLRDAMKTYAEEAKNQLSFKEKEDIISNLGDLGEDDEGVEIELDLSITQEQLREVLSPIFQKAVDICKQLLERNNMTGCQLSSLILVGGPTHSPIIRDMLREQVSKNVNTSIDPMTAVACGAALYASTIDNEAKQELASGTVALEVSYEATSVETMEFATVKLDKAKSTGNIPAKLYVEFTRGDMAWSSGKVEINEIGDVIECQLVEGKPNSFVIKAYDEQGNSVSCYPNEISIIQGSKVGSATLPYNIGIEIWNAEKGRAVFTAIKGLERNKTLPATGTRNGLKTSAELRPGMLTDVVRIPVYQADEGAEGMRAANYEFVYEVKITGDDVPDVIPEGSDVDITLKVDRSEMMTMEVFFPLIGYSTTIETPRDTIQKEVSDEYLEKEIDKARAETQKLQKSGADMSEIHDGIDSVEQELQNGDQKKQVLQHLKEVLRKIDKADSEGEWGRIEKELRGKFKMLEEDNEKYCKGNTETAAAVQQICEQVDVCIRQQDVAMGKELLDVMHALNFKIATVEYFSVWIIDWHKRFSSIAWKDSTRARSLINQGLSIINVGPTAQQLSPIVSGIIDLLPASQVPAGAKGLLQ